jgi:hypothetical protein
MKRKIKAKYGSHFNDTQASEIASFLEKHFPDGILDATHVLELAKPKNSPIHKYFCWDDTEAAKRYRLYQARNLINCLVVEIQDVEVRKYTMPVVVDGYDHKQYVEINVAKKSNSIWDQVLERAIKEAKSWQARYSNLKELKPIFGLIAKTEKKLIKQGVIENENSK